MQKQIAYDILKHEKGVASLTLSKLAKLANENFVSRAPEHVVNAEREKKTKLEALIENLTLSLENLGK